MLMLPTLKAQTAKANLIIQEESHLVLTLMLFEMPSLVSKHRVDFQVYMEACKAFSKWNISSFLVTDDHKFYKLYLHSAIAKEPLHTICPLTLARCTHQDYWGSHSRSVRLRATTVHITSLEASIYTFPLFFTIILY